MSAKMASRTCPPQAILLVPEQAGPDGYQTIAESAVSSGMVTLALARGFQALEQQTQQRVDPRGPRRVLPFVGMGGMVIAGGGLEHRARGRLDVGRLEGALLHAVG